MAKHLYWIIPTALCVGWIAMMTRDYNIEFEKQRAFMMSACVSAGGQWQRDGWSNYFNCARPKDGASQ